MGKLFKIITNFRELENWTEFAYVVHKHQDYNSQ